MRAPPPSPRITKSPEFTEPGISRHFDRVALDVSRELSARPTRTEAVDNILLISPNGTVYKVTVSNAGVLTTEVMPS